MSDADFSGLSHPIQPMPDDVREHPYVNMKCQERAPHA